MPSKKVLSVVIVCLSTIISTFLIVSVPTFQKSTIKKAGVLKIENSPIEIAPKNDEWKKLLSNVKSSDEKNNSSPKVNTVPHTSTSLTANAARDLISQYIILTKDGSFTEAERNTLLNNIFSQSKYTQSSGPVYLSSNLKITTTNTSQTLTDYKTRVELVLKNRSSEIKENPQDIILSGMENKDEEILKKLDPIITSGKKMIQDLLEVETPTTAVKVHLGIINATSKVINDIENSRNALSDPVKGLISLSQISKNILEFQTALANLNLFLKKI